METINDQNRLEEDLHQTCSSQVWTGQNDRFLKAIQTRLQRAERTDLIISFIMESGVRILLEQLKGAEKLRILTGSYLNITQPWALRILKEECLPGTQIRFFQDHSVSFHPKSWIFHYPDGEVEAIVGSSNLSLSALTSGVEWNGSLCNDDAIELSKRFDHLFEYEAIEVTDQVLDEYSKNWKKPVVTVMDEETRAEGIIVPRGVQIEALYALKEARRNGASKGLVQAATGVGKTFLAAFDSKTFKRILFVAHTEEILEQAIKSFHAVRPGLSIGRIFRQYRETDGEAVFASVQSLSNMIKDGKFSPEDFDYLVVDEFHHAVSKSYRTITDFFNPKFLLGLTATPDRLDGRDVYALCDYNVPYSITLQDAINKGILSPFHYYGIFDETDYSGLNVRNGRYSQTELTRLYKEAGKRTELILSHFQKHSPKQTLAFCASKEHADFMCSVFNENGIPSAAVYSDSQVKRDEAIRALNEGKIKVIFSVDMFNEGVDIPKTDLVMMLRPTESPTIFLQQLGRGLRKAENKPYLTVLDFIGNYKNASRISQLLSGREKDCSLIGNLRLPLDCQADFDLKLIDLFREMEKRSRSLDLQFFDEFERIKKEEGHRPTRMDLFVGMDGDLLDRLKKRGNPLKKYFPWLHDHGFLTKDEENLYKSKAGDLLRFFETTPMTKLNKVPLLLAFAEQSRIAQSVSQEQILKTWKQFFRSDQNWRDIEGIHSFAEFEKMSDKDHLQRLKRYPMKLLIDNSKGLILSDGNGGLKLADEILPFLTDPDFVRHWKDILNLRTMEYRRKKGLFNRSND